jgi:dolichol-phosphate mannosyltransferase
MENSGCRGVKYLVVIPVLNEVKAIGFVLDEVLSIGISRDNVVVVDGGSTDGTREAVFSRGVKLVDQLGEGKSGAIKTAATLAGGYDYVVVMDGDYTYPAKYIPILVEKTCREGYDLVIGARRKLELGAQSVLYRFGNKVLSTVFNILFGTKLSDVLSGMYVVRSDVLKEISFESRGFSIESEIVSHAVSQGYRVSEVPIEYRRRLDVSAKKLKIFHGVHIFLEIVRMAWRYNPTFFIFILGSLMIIVGLPLGLYVAYHYFFTGIKYYVKGLVAIILTLAGFQSLLLAILSLYMKRSELRIMRELRRSRK